MLLKISHMTLSPILISHRYYKIFLDITLLTSRRRCTAAAAAMLLPTQCRCRHAATAAALLLPLRCHRRPTAATALPIAMLLLQYLPGFHCCKSRTVLKLPLMPPPPPRPLLRCCAVAATKPSLMGFCRRQCRNAAKLLPLLPG